MFLTVSTTHQPATDLGYLLHKHPDRVQEFTQSFGTATVFYPQADEQRCTAALMLEIDPVRLARSRVARSGDFSLAHYVNDRSYAASSLLGVALADVFSTARSGRCRANQELADSAIPLEITIPVLPCRGGAQIAHRVFEPLGWTVLAEPIVLDERFPEWGDSAYVRLKLTGTLRLADALSQLHVLLPVLDEAKHYWQGPDEVDKLLTSGEGWLVDHPERELITHRYLGQHRSLIHPALERLAELSDLAPDVDAELAQPVADRRTSLRELRHDAVCQAVAELGATSVIDLGCGPGQLLDRLLKLPSVQRVTGTDVSVRSLKQAARRLRVDDQSERQAERLTLFQSALTYEDDRYTGFDAAVLMEVVEHVDPTRLGALEHVVFGAAKPGAVIVTTPNSDYNVLYPDLVGMRHPDHRFEWTRDEFARWCDRVAAIHGYRVERCGVGDSHAELGTPTQLAVFTKNGADDD